MTDNVVALPGLTFTSVDDDSAAIVSFLEKALDDARAGRLKCAAFVALKHDGGLASGFRSSSSNVELFGLVHYLARRIGEVSWGDP